MEGRCIRTEPAWGCSRDGAKQHKGFSPARRLGSRRAPRQRGQGNVQFCMQHSTIVCKFAQTIYQEIVQNTVQYCTILYNMYNFETISTILQYYNMYNRAKIMCTILVIFHNIYVHIVRNIYFGIVHIIVRVVQYEINIAYKFVHGIL